uniref:Reverse transcriptase domain-containing protein n=1 Tax=Anolis carolinensis TaxID=28377 RepID=A0A803T1S1_ANOCA
MGDFNGLMNCEIDRNPGRNSRDKKFKGLLSKDFRNFKEEYDLDDVWRTHHGEEKDYTFYSAKNKSWSRIDMVWTSKSLSPLVQNIKILPRTDTDHNPIEVTLNKKEKHWRWKLDSNLLKRKEDIGKNRALLEEFFKINDNQETPLHIVWDASKATMRGYLIEQGIWKKREKQKQIKIIMEEIEKIEKELKRKPRDSNLLLRLEMTQKKREYFDLEERAKQMNYIKQTHFESANKPGRWLSRKLRKRKEATYIKRIKTGGKYHYLEEDILKQFAQYYKLLYGKDPIEKEKITGYLGKLKLQKITEKEREDLNKEISKKEIQAAIRKLDSSKSPGPDGLTAIYYKVFEGELTPYLLKIMNEIREKGKMPDSWKEALITVIHKENSDPEDIKNYRPISLLNVDYKIFSNIIAERLKIFFKKWIKEEQSGFLPNRNIKDNIRLVVDLLEYHESQNQQEILLLAVDAEKAFDRVNWDYFKLLIQELDMGYHLQNSIEAIYQRQKAKIMVNGKVTEELEIGKGTRQGCPLSPLIFIMTLETLLINIRSNEELQGTTIQGVQYKIQAYADDIICFIGDPAKKGEKWISIIKEYGEVAGLMINMNKTKALAKNINKAKQKLISEKLGIEITPKIKYLGIYISSKNSQLLKNNYDKTWKNIKMDLENWNNLKISLMGRISAVKMSILPKMLFLFQCLPILRSQKIFTTWNKDLSRFIWQGKKTRIKRINLIDDKRRGGFAMPDLKTYYEACNLIWIKDWMQLENKRILTVEGFDLRVGWHSYLWYDKIKIEKNFGNHFIRSTLIKTWDKYKLRMYNKTPIWISPIEAVQRRLLGWSQWPNYETLIKLHGSELRLKSQEELKAENLNITWLQYGQLKEYYKKDKVKGFMGKNNLWDRILFTTGRLISKFIGYYWNGIQR